MNASQRFRRDRPCPVCGGYPEAPHGRGVRCWGFLSDDGEWARCTREERAGALEPHQGSATYAHRLIGECKCGTRHGTNGGAVVTRARAWRYVHPSGAVVEHHREDRADGSKSVWWGRDGHRGLDGLRVEDLPVDGVEQLEHLPKGSRVVLVEGEKAREALTRRGIVAVATVTGAKGTPSDASLQPLLDYAVILWPDDDDDGRTHLRRIAERLRAMGHENIRTLEWTDAPAHGDAADFFASDGTVEDFELLAEAAPLWEPAPSTSSGSSPNAIPDGARAIVASSVKRQRIEYLDDERMIPLGTVTVLAGLPGLGKSQWTMRLAARNPGGTLIATAEDSPEAVVRPRLEAAGADLSCVRFVVMRREGNDEGIDLPDDVAELDRLVVESRATLVIIDPLMAHLPDKVNSWRDQSIRRALAPLHRLAEERGCAIIVVVHLNKRDGDDPLQRVGGSIGIVAAARSVLLLARDPDDPEGEAGCLRVLAHVKSNYSETRPSLALRIEAILVDPEGDRIDTSRIVVTGESPHLGRDLLAVDDREERSSVEEGVSFLLVELAKGPRGSEEVERAARQAGVSPASLRRAKKQAGVQSRRIGEAGVRGGGAWVWELPQAADQNARPPYGPDAHLNRNGPIPWPVDLDAQRIYAAEHLNRPGRDDPLGEPESPDDELLPPMADPDEIVEIEL